MQKIADHSGILSARGRCRWRSGTRWVHLTAETSRTRPSYFLAHFQWPAKRPRPIPRQVRGPGQSGIGLAGWALQCRSIDKLAKGRSLRWKGPWSSTRQPGWLFGPCDLQSVRIMRPLRVGQKKQAQRSPKIQGWQKWHRQMERTILEKPAPLR